MVSLVKYSNDLQSITYIKIHHYLQKGKNIRIKNRTRKYQNKKEKKNRTRKLVVQLTDSHSPPFHEILFGYLINLILMT